MPGSQIVWGERKSGWPRKMRGRHHSPQPSSFFLSLAPCCWPSTIWEPGTGSIQSCVLICFKESGIVPFALLFQPTPLTYPSAFHTSFSINSQVVTVVQSKMIVYWRGGGGRQAKRRQEAGFQVGGCNSEPCGRGWLPSNGLLGMCHWMGLHFHDSTKINFPTD